ncbi:MAG: methyltransferase domain-containing protein [Proteobacteria bacterium]|nr:methyltransferase domain-containing protein [Pseudomonadota bacterium]
MSDPEEKDDILDLTADMSATSGESSASAGAASVVMVAPVPVENTPSTASANIMTSVQHRDDTVATVAETEAATSPVNAVMPDGDAVSDATESASVNAAEIPFARMNPLPATSASTPATSAATDDDNTTLEDFPTAPAVPEENAAPNEATSDAEEPQADASTDEGADIDADDLFELDEQLVVESGEVPVSVADEPVAHAFDFGTPEMVFDELPPEPPTTGPPAIETPTIHEDAAPASAEEKYISFLPAPDFELEGESELDESDLEEEDGHDEEPEVELDIGDAEMLATPAVPPVGPKGARPFDSFFKNDISAAEQAASGAFTSGGAARRRRGAPQDWWASIFDDEYLMLLPPQSAYEQQKQMDFIQSSLGLPPGTLLLDMACGNGSNAIGMAKRNYRMVGVDLSLSMLARAGEAAQEAGQKINFIHGDMRDLGFDKTFDGIICMDTSFGFFDEATNVKVLTSVYKALKPGGVFLLEVANRDFVVKQQPNLLWFQMDNMVCMEETDFNYINSRLYITRQLIIGDNEKQSRHEFSLRLYSLHEIGQMMHATGFAVTKVSGHRATPGAFFGPESSKLIIVAERRRD